MRYYIAVGGEMVSVRIYTAPNGKSPFAQWFHALRDTSGRLTVAARLLRVRLGNFGDCKAVGAGVLELRVGIGPGYRVYFGRDGEDVVILLCGGDKGTQKRDIVKAKAYWDDYRRRRNAEDLKL